MNPSSQKAAWPASISARCGSASPLAIPIGPSPVRWKTIRGKEAGTRRQRFRRLVAEENVSLFVVGLPVHLSGLESQKSHEARQFGKWLEEITGMPVEFFDERFTSVEAEQYLLGADMTRKKRKERLDKIAAQILLSAYLESNAQHSEPPRGLDD